MMHAYRDQFIPDEPLTINEGFIADLFIDEDEEDDFDLEDRDNDRNSTKRI